MKIVQLYSQAMNIYGDTGNILALKRRLERYGAAPEIVQYNPGDNFPTDADIIIGGGGQDSGQEKVIDDLQTLAPYLRELAESGVPMLMVCGLYQLFGKFFKTKEGKLLKGIGVFDVETYGKDKRLIGNVRAESSIFGTVLGYENHSGQTYLGANSKPLAEKVLLGVGNNEEDSGEGCIKNACIGTYLHGSVLPKNPAITDFLIERAYTRKKKSLPELLDDEFRFDELTKKARAVAERLTR